MLRYTNDELDELRAARREHPTMSQHGLARHIYFNNHHHIPAFRTTHSIYGALRRVESAVAAAATAGIAAARENANV